ncbi:HET-domain-containing protein [Stipitochalara longipes BDJ]|nr:HET-domain-containing protein [Stipitochalara longipes BDJ]
MEAALSSPSEPPATSYAYQPLDRDTQSIRLIMLQPASSFASDIHCDIYHVSLSTQPDYEALSYAWGDAAVTAPIFLQGFRFEATVNLISALRHLRYEDRPRTLWVDAICIDQSNVQERGHQVAFMAKIYSLARCDILWLGDDLQDDAGDVFNIIQDTVSTLNRFPSESEVQTYQTIAYDLLDKIPISKFRRILKDRPVWDRIWVVQEVVVSENISLQCGLRSLPWSSLSIFINIFLSLEGIMSTDSKILLERPKVITCWSAAREMDYVRRYHSKPYDLEILELWERFGEWKATDPRDRVFALLGISNPSGLDADYTKEASDVFQEVVRFTISNSQNLDALCMDNAIRSTALANSFFPSWVPDFSSWGFRYSIFHSTYSLFQAGGNSVQLDDSILSSSATSTLALFGVLLDTASKIYPCDSFYRWNKLPEFVQAIPRTVFEGQYHNGDSNLIAYARAMTGDVSYERVGHRQSQREAAALSSEIRSLLTWQGRLYRRIRSFMPARMRDRFPDAFQRREYAQPKLTSGLPTFVKYDFCTTTEKFMAMIPASSKIDDVLCVLYGSKYPHVLRKVPGKEDTYTLVGTAYVHGFMDGEAIEWRNQGKLKEQRFNLI